MENQIIKNEEFEKILLEAKVLDPFSAEEERSGMWAAENKNEFFLKGRNSSLIDAIHIAEEGNKITTNHFVNSKYYGFVIDELLSSLVKLDFDLFNAPIDFCEWEHSSKKTSIYYENRLISPDYLYKLIIALRIKREADTKIKSILEIGAGAGTLARCMKQINPDAKYYIIDIPGTLYFSYIFLRANFKNSKFKIITSKSQFLENEDADFIFISAELYKHIPKWDIDLVINTHSLGEMSQPMVNSYMNLIQNNLNVSYLYSLNRLLQIPENVNDDIDTSYQASVSLNIDNFWEVKKFNYCPDFVKSMRYKIDTETTLELFLKRDSNIENKFREDRSKELFMQSQKQFVKSEKWLSLILESIFLNPTNENMLPYYEYLVEIKARDRFYFYQILKEKVNIPIHNPYSNSIIKKNSIKKFVARKIMSLAIRLNKFLIK